MTPPPASQASMRVAFWIWMLVVVLGLAIMVTLPLAGS